MTRSNARSSQHGHSLAVPAVMSLACSVAELIKSTDDNASAVDSAYMAHVAAYYIVVACVIQILCMSRLRAVAWTFAAPMLLYQLAAPIKTVGRATLA
jgi:Na+-transporting NADH:ubiquinone oxidoreductase subunit NqrE